MKAAIKLQLFFFLVMTSSLFAQFNVNNLSLEAGYGYTGAIWPYQKLYKSNFSGFNHYNVGIRYMFNEKFGAKATYKVDHFVNDPGGKVGITYSAIGLSGIYNVGKQLGLTYLTRDKLGINAHVDAGVAFGYVIEQNKPERIGVVGIGLTPMFNISNNFALTADFTHNFTMKQHYGFDGALLSKDYTPESGSYYNFSFGIIYYLGENKYHSDWY